MNSVSIAGRALFGAALTGLGLVPFFAGRLPAALVPLESPLPPAIACGLGGLLILGALAATTREPSVAPSLWLASFPALVLVTLHFPRLIGEPRNPVFWSATFQVAALVAGALLLLPNRTAGRVMMAVALAGFGIQHFMYPQFIAALIPTWIPDPIFWAWATGGAFLAASLSALLEKQIRLSGTLLSLMFLSWVAIVHIPRIMARPGLEPGWTSGIFAFGMAGVALLLARGHRAARAGSGSGNPDVDPATVRSSGR